MGPPPVLKSRGGGAVRDQLRMARGRTSRRRRLPRLYAMTPKSNRASFRIENAGQVHGLGDARLEEGPLGRGPLGGDCLPAHLLGSPRPARSVGAPRAEGRTTPASPLVVFRIEPVPQPVSRQTERQCQ